MTHNRPDNSQAGDAIISVSHHTTALSLYQKTADFLSSQELNLHLIHSHILEQLSIEQQHASMSQPPQQLFPSLWFVVWSAHPQAPQARTLDLIVGLTTGPLGSRPVFIGSPHHSSSLNTAFLKSRASHLVCALLDHVTVERVFSVFGPRRIVQAFTATWSNATGVYPIDSPFLAAKYRICTLNTLAAPVPIPQGDQMRLATSADIASVAELLRDRSVEWGPYMLTSTRAWQEATLFVTSSLVFVYETRNRLIASVIAVERTTQSVACITKLYTTPQQRNQGYATRLLLFVTQILLSQSKRCVTLYLPEGSRAAEQTVTRVGFVDVSSAQFRGERDWLEQGFEDMNLGHW